MLGHGRENPKLIYHRFVLIHSTQDLFPKYSHNVLGWGGGGHTPIRQINPEYDSTVSEISVVNRKSAQNCGEFKKDVL